MIPRCPDCGEARGGRYCYRLGHPDVCWPCWMARTGLGPIPAHRPTPEFEWVAFRMTIIDAIWAADQQRFAYVDENTIGGACPVCTAGHVRVDFHGTAARADLSCSLGCAEADIAHGIAGRRATR
jgi:hypothetical protein